MSAWRNIREAVAADRRALLDAFGDRDPGPAWLHRGAAALLVHRAAHELEARGWSRLAALLAFANLILTGAELATTASLAPGTVLLDPSGVVLDATIGRGCVVDAQVVIGPAWTDDARRRVTDVGGGPGRPVLGAGVVLGVGAMVLGPVRVGEDATIGPRCIVQEDVEAGGSVAPPRARNVPNLAAAGPLGTR